MPVRVVVVRIVDVGSPDLLPPPVNGLRGVGHDAVVDVGDRLRQLNPGVQAVDVFQNEPERDSEMVAPAVEKGRVRVDPDVVVEAQRDHRRVVNPDVGATLDRVAGHDELVVPCTARKPGGDLADMDRGNRFVYFVFGQKDIIVGGLHIADGDFDEGAGGEDLGGFIRGDGRDAAVKDFTGPVPGREFNVFGWIIIENFEVVHFGVFLLGQ